jgi:arylsulfatase A-like enzyme
MKGTGKETPKHTFLFILDTIRKDHMSLYGYQRKTTPNIEKLAEQADTYNWAFAPSSYTLASIPSLFSGKYPINTANLFTGGVFNESDFENLKLLREQGYKTAFFTGNIVTSSKNTNLNKFFDYFWDKLTEQELNRKNMFYQKADKILAAVKEFIEKSKKEKLFVVIHLMESHGHYLPDTESIFKNDKLYKTDKRRITRVVNDIFTGVPIGLLKKEKVAPRYQLLNLIEGPSGEIEDFERNVAGYIAKYDMGIYLQDKTLGEFFNFLNSQKIYDQSQIIITSDHGELLGEENIFFSHVGFTHPVLVNVPLIIKNQNQNSPELNNSNFSTKNLLSTVFGLKLDSLDNQTFEDEDDKIYSFTAKSISIIDGPMFYLIHNGDFRHPETFKECIYPTKSLNLENAIKNFEEFNVDFFFRIYKKDKRGFRRIKPKNEIPEDIIGPLLKSYKPSFKFIKELYSLETEKANKEIRSLKYQLRSNQSQSDKIYDARSWKLITRLKKLKSHIPFISKL